MSKSSKFEFPHPKMPVATSRRHYIFLGEFRILNQKPWFVTHATWEGFKHPVFIHVYPCISGGWFANFPPSMAITTEKKAVVYLTTWFKIGQWTNVSPYFFRANPCVMTKVNFCKLTFYSCFVMEDTLHRCVFQVIFVPPEMWIQQNLQVQHVRNATSGAAKLQVREQRVRDKQKMVQFHDSSKTSESLLLLL